MAFTEEQEEFKAEALELLEVSENSLLKLDRGGEFRACYDAVFRGFHNLKGASGMMELVDLQSHVHELESMLIQFKESDAIPKEYISLFLRGIDAAREILQGKSVVFDFSLGASVSAKPVEIPLKSKNHIPQSAVEEFMAECEETIDRVSDLLQLVESNQHTRENLEALYRDIHSLKGASYLFSFNSIGDTAHSMETILDGVRNETERPSKEILDTLFASLKIIENEVHNTSRVQLQTVAEKPQPVESEGTGSIRVSVALLDNLMTLMGEMVLVRNQVLQFTSKSDDLEFLNLSKRLNVVTNEIQAETMKTRMQPIGNVLGKFNRVVRDLSQDLKKEISLTIIGSETELDKSLLESIKDPLTHIVRNSCDHGIETPHIRVANGKNKTGTITIRSYHEGGQVVIEVADDGKGLNKEFLLKKGIEKGLISQTQAATMTEKEIFQLIFAPGFSTASSITNVSGRGVGMDVVRTNVEKIGGSVELASTANKGTVTKLKIPLTLAIVPALIIKSSNETFAIPQIKLEELVRLDPSTDDSTIEYLHGSPVYRLRGNILPLVNLNEILGLSKSENVASPIKNIAVLKADHCSFGLLVDEIQDTADIVVKPINRLLKTFQVYSGATILGDGSIALILDVLGISKVARLAGDAQKADAANQKQSEHNKNAEFQEFLLVRVNSPTKHAILLGEVYRLEEFNKSDVELSGSQRVVRYGKFLLPLLSVSEALGYGISEKSVTSETISVVVVQKAGCLYGLEVDDIVDTLSTDIPVDNSLSKQSGIFGNLNMADELMVLIDTFSLIDRTFPSDNSQVRASMTQIPPENLRILFAEDTAFFRRAISEVLVKAGHQVTTVNDGQEAIELLEKNPQAFDLIVSDIEMPRMNGFELAKAIRSNKSLSALPLLAISSRADKSYSDTGISAGFNIYLEKLKPTNLLDAVCTLCSSERSA